MEAPEALITTGPYGFSRVVDKYDDIKEGLKHGWITSITVRSGCWLDSVQVCYGSYSTPVYGGNGGNCGKVELQPDECITHVWGSAGQFIDKLVFVTNRRRKFEFGGSGQNGTGFDAPAPAGHMLVGIRAVAGKYLDQIELVWGKIPDTGAPAADPEQCYDISQLPADVTMEVAKHLGHAQLLELEQTCKYWHMICKHGYLWYNKIVQEIGEGFIPQGIHRPTCFDDPDMYDFRKLYFQLKQARQSVANKFAVVHLNGQYLEKVPDEESPFGEVIHLLSVCWLDIRASVVLPPGKYNVAWRIKLGDQSNVGDGLTFKALAQPVDASGSKGEVACTLLTQEEVDASYRDVRSWFLLGLGSFQLEKPSNVVLECTAYDGAWKTGVSWDYVEISPIP